MIAAELDVKVGIDGDVKPNPGGRPYGLVEVPRPWYGWKDKGKLSPKAGISPVVELPTWVLATYSGGIPYGWRMNDETLGV